MTEKSIQSPCSNLANKFDRNALIFRREATCVQITLSVHPSNRVCSYIGISVRPIRQLAPRQSVPRATSYNDHLKVKIWNKPT